MYCTLTIARYPKFLGIFGFISMAIFRIPLYFNKHLIFWKLLGCGKNGTFDIVPDWRQWCILSVKSENIQSELHGNFIKSWYQFFKVEVFTVILKITEGHGTWDKFKFYNSIKPVIETNGPIAVLTRATIKFSKLNSFWKNVKPVANQMNKANGFIFSVGLGEIPLIKQATLSFWKSEKQMKQFAYGMGVHKEVVRMTHKEKWYSEEMFVRFKPILSKGTIKGNNPLKDYSEIKIE
jgi:hypothetical protein